MPTLTSARVAAQRRSAVVVLAAMAMVSSFGACGPRATASAIPDDVASMEIPTMPPDDFASGTAACIDAPTMAIIDQLRAPGADVPALLAANDDALISGLSDLESSDPAVLEWRDALLSALASGDMTAGAAQVAALAADEVTLTPC